MFVSAEPLKAKLRRKEPVFGTWVTIPAVEVVEILADAGFDFLVVDTEHTVADDRDVRTLVAVIAAREVPTVVRVAGNDPVRIKRVLDAGASGVLVPMVNSSQEAEAALKAIRYPPEGERGVGYGRAQGYGFRFSEYLERANKEVLVALQIEHRIGAENVEQIVAVPGIDVIFMGPADLSASMGLLGQVSHPSVTAEVARVRTVALSKGIAAGYHVIDPGHLPQRLAEGYTFLAVGIDQRYLGVGARADLAAARRATA